jgi:hypothetical protein
VKRGSKGGHVDKKKTIEEVKPYFEVLKTLVGKQAPISTTQGLELGMNSFIEGKSNPLRNNYLNGNIKTAFSIS